ncbi:MAG: ComEC/Rec2 family competence protein [Synergistaceae bacterium]|nr:ComEC/Rec2 family competence protein [Synergistaceae bacterium]
MSSAFGRGHALIVQTGEGDYLVKRPKDENYNLGEALSLRGWIKPFPVIDDNSKFDEAKFWKSKGVRAELAVSSIERGTSGEANLHSIRQWIHDKIKSIPNTLRGYLDAMWTGLRDAELNEKHQRWGTSHLLAVSGFHVGLIAGLIESIFYFSRFRFRLRGIISSIFMWMYILISGAAPSAIRAAFMFQTGIIAGIIGRRVHAVNSVAVAATAMLLYSPFLFWNVGWRLSVIAALTITALTEIILDKKFKPWTWSIIPPAVTITTYPVVSSVFGSVPVVGVVLNLIAVPFFAFAFPFISIVAFIGVLQNVTDASLRLYGYIADFFTWILPWRVPYNTFLSMFCVLFFYGLMCSVLKNREELGVRSEELGVRSEE